MTTTNLAKRKPRPPTAPTAPPAPAEVDEQGFTAKARSVLGPIPSPAEAAVLRQQELDQAQAGFDSALSAARGEPIPGAVPADPPPAAMEAMQASAARLAGLETEAAAVTDELLRAKADDPAGISKLRARSRTLAEALVAARIVAAEANLAVTVARSEALSTVEVEAAGRVRALKAAQQVVTFELGQATSAVGQVRGAQFTQARAVYRAEEAVSAARGAAAGGAS